ncbi:C-type mannose receptor 2 [Lates calcarifer]|uniref:C-type mannose receptor 2 n=1 Tax=Lates calcarifer TaxID=8187 RepID=A0AAJ8DUU8_LATCA|nr:C-type mannose receptor 2 [Lates calcarifer]
MIINVNQNRAKMKWSLFLLSLMGQCFLSTCRLYEYHYISESKTWSEAQSYCREKYTDLATVYDMTDMKRLLDSTENQGEAWIGLCNNPGKENRKWHWSLPGVEYNESEAKYLESLNNGDDKNCVYMDESKTYMAKECTKELNEFICYDERRKSTKTFHLINNEKTWPQAQNYCREHHTDLISGVHQLEDEEFKTQGKSKRLWIGLFRDTWRWSDESSFSFRYWDLELFKDERNKKCAMTVLDRSGRWSSDECNKSKTLLLTAEKTTTDLVSITNPDQQRWVQERARKASTPFVWLGLRYTCTLDLWFWVNDQLVCYDKWAPGQNTESCYTSAAMEKEAPHQWFHKADTNTFNFICAVRKM